MKCPVCQAKLLPVDGEMFCLQCGHTLASKPEAGDLGPAVEETVDPLLQKAITDAVKHPIDFRLPVSGAPATKSTTSFNSMRSALAPARLDVAKASVPVRVEKPTSIPAVPAIQTPAQPERKSAMAAFVNSMRLKSHTSETVAAKPKHSMISMRSILAPHQPALAGNGHIPVQGEVPVAEPVHPAEPSAEKTPRSKVSVNWSALPIAWVIGLLVFGVFLLANGAIQYYYANRVFPGVRVENVSLGGAPLDQVQSRLAASEAQPALTASNGSVKYALDTNSLATSDLNEAEAQARDAGHTTPLPIAGLLETLFSKPISVGWQVSATQASALAQHLASVVDTSASNAAPMIVGSQAFVVPEKTGTRLSVQTLAAEIKGAYGRQTTIILDPSKIVPAVSSNSYANDVTSAQSAIALTVHMTLKGVDYTPTPQQIGSWLVFNGPGKGVAVDGSQVASYIASIPGKFDRSASTNALLSAIQSRQSINYNISTSKITPTPSLPRALATLPVVTYSYCVQTEASSEGKLLTAEAASVLSDTSGWSLGGRIRFVPVTAGCNFAFDLVQPSGMSGISPACAGQSTCQVGSVLAIDAAKWNSAPSSWIGTLASYRMGMINQNVGNWLGFEHASCTTKSSAQPILEAPAVVLDGCSPNWYQVPTGSLGSKVPAGF